MKDAVTQTDRSDWQLIKAKLARDKLQKEATAQNYQLVDNVSSLISNLQPKR